MTEKEIKSIIIDNQNPEKEIADRFAHMKTTFLFISCIVLLGAYLYVRVNNNDAEVKELKKQIFKRDVVNIHNKIVHEQDSITIYDLSEGAFN